MSFADQFRRAVRESGLTCYKIAQASGVSNATLSRLLSGERFLSERGMNAVAGVLGLRIVADRPRSHPAKARSGRKEG